MKQIHLLFCLLLTGLNSYLLNAQHIYSSPTIEYRELISKSDLTYGFPVSTSEEGMPIGNGVMGTLVWTTPSALRFQINRVDVFGNNATSDNFFQRHTDYCGGTGFIDINFPGAEEVFSAPDFYQHLSCYNATLTTNGKNVETESFIWSDQDVMIVNVKDQRKHSPVIIHLRPLRPVVTHTGDHTAISVLEQKGDAIVLTQTFTEKEYICKSALAIRIEGIPSRAWLANESDMTLTISSGEGSFRIFVSSGATFEKETDITKEVLLKLDNAISTGYDSILHTHISWWSSFWERSFIELDSPDGIANDIMSHYNYFLYLMGSSSRGSYQPKFNGMLWTTGGDARMWGSQFWGTNQSCYYNGLFPTNRPELMRPVFEMYTNMAPSLERASVQQWGSKGIFIPETVSFDGLAELPEEIAAEMQDLFLLRKPWEEASEQFKEFAYTKMPHNSRWNFQMDVGWENGKWISRNKGGGIFGEVTHIFARGAKIAYQYWLQYEYTQDQKWLEERAYPLLKGVAEFYRNFPNLKKEEDGKYHIRHVNDNEPMWDTHNCFEEISSIMGLFPTAIKAAELLHTDAGLREAWQEVLDNLSPLPTSDLYPELSGEPRRFVRSMPGILHGDPRSLPDRNNVTVCFFDLCTLESTNKELTETIQNTFDAYYPGGVNTENKVYVMSKLNVIGTQLGRVDATRYLIPNQIRTAETEVMRNRMDLREGYQTTGAQRLGRVVDALHHALCQSIPPYPGEESVIRLFPAWPAEWNARYSLLCRGNFMVSSSFQNGKIEFVEIKSNAGKECKIRNPWGKDKISIYKNGLKQKETGEELLTFPTEINDVFVLLKE